MNMTVFDYHQGIYLRLMSGINLQNINVIVKVCSFIAIHTDAEAVRLRMKQLQPLFIFQSMIY